uniref:Uncharacterized protein LOC104245160 n=1 Tax=Nicotiana sylvestris TaxID=4096 RepID=A0A1U7Y4J5_NICSY|nr:PREDICTED: uncharacterized protein LOC104245160 [Nicotiana sylvestris]XP_016443470.1 PREDICTED: uncharacterized protein LOC107768834 [Nicotiana tabacum]
MANVLHHRHQSMGSAYYMLESLKKMFGEKNRVAKQTSMKALLNIKMAEGSSIIDHVLKIMDLLNELEVLEAVIYKKSQVEMQAPVVELNFEKASVSKPRGDKKKKRLARFWHLEVQLRYEKAQRKVLSLQATRDNALPIWQS